jgi:hypothetical protein
VDAVCGDCPSGLRRPVDGRELPVRNGEFDGAMPWVMLDFLRAAMQRHDKRDLVSGRQPQAVERNSELQDPADGDPEPEARDR